MNGGYSSVQRGGDLSGPIREQIMMGANALLQERFCDAVTIARDLVAPLMNSQESGVAEIAEETRDTADRVLAHLQCNQQSQQPVQQTVEGEPTPAPRGPTGQLPPPQVRQPAAGGTSGGAGASNANAGSSASSAAGSNNSGAAGSNNSGAAGSGGANNSGSAASGATVGSSPTARRNALRLTPTGIPSPLNSEVNSLVRNSQTGSVLATGVAGPRTTRKGNAQNTGIELPTRRNLSASSRGPAAGSGTTAPSRAQVPAPETTANAPAENETNATFRARKVREARLLNAGQAGVASRTAANAAEAARILALRQKANAVRGQQFAANRAKDTRAANAANAAAAAERAKVVASLQSSTGPSPLAAGLGQTASMAAKFNAMAKAQAPTATAVAAPAAAATGERSFLQNQPPTTPLIGGRRTKKSKGRKNNRKSRRQQ